MLLVSPSWGRSPGGDALGRVLACVDVCWGPSRSVLEASPPGSALRPGALPRICQSLRVRTPMCCDSSRFHSTNGWRWSDDDEDEGMQPQTLVPAETCSSRCSHVASQPADLQEDHLLRTPAPNEPCGCSLLWSGMTHKDGHLQQPSTQTPHPAFPVMVTRLHKKQPGE